MKNIIPPPTQILSSHQEEAPFAKQRAKDSVERRAEEIAVIEDHPVATDSDRDQARHELNGETLPPTLEDDAETMESLSRDPSDPPAHHGHQTPMLEGADEEDGREMLVNEGVEEAQHDQMLAARQRKSS